jgi:hypothetical protein
MDEAAPAAHIGRLMTGYWISQALHVAAKLELADHLAGGPRTADELAPLCQAHAPSLYRLLRALASVGVFRERDDHMFELTPPAELLRKESPESQWAWAMMMGDEHYHAWGELLHSIRTGEGGFRKIYGEGVFDYLSHQPGQAKIFDAAMTSIHGRETVPMLKSYNFGQFTSIIDIGGGNGTLMSQLLAQYPHVRGAVFDLPHVIERTRSRLAERTELPTIELHSGSFFESVPAGYDVYLMRHIIHDWDDEKCITILRHCAAVLPPGGKVLVIEGVIPPGNGESFSKWLDLNMLVLPEGKERTRAEYESLFAAAGLRLTQVVATGCEIDIIEASTA